MKFFIIDDDAEVLSLLRHVLEGAGHSVAGATAAAEALPRIAELRPDCVVTDIMMPHMDGFELLRALRRLPGLAGMKIVVLSAKTYEFDRRRAKELGADGFIAKPFSRDMLLDAILDVVSNRVVVTY